MPIRRQGFGGSGRFIPPEFFGLSGLGSALSQVGEAIRRAEDREAAEKDRELNRALTLLSAGADPEVVNQQLQASGAVPEGVELQQPMSVALGKFTRQAFDKFEAGEELSTMEQQALQAAMFSDPNSDLARQISEQGLEQGEIQTSMLRREFESLLNLDESANKLMSSDSRFQEFAGAGLEGLRAGMSLHGVNVQDEELANQIRRIELAEREAQATGERFRQRLAENIRQAKMREFFQQQGVQIDRERLNLARQEAEREAQEQAPFVNEMVDQAAELSALTSVPIQTVWSFLNQEPTPPQITQILTEGQDLLRERTRAGIEHTVREAKGSDELAALDGMIGMIESGVVDEEQLRVQMAKQAGEVVNQFSGGRFTVDVDTVPRFFGLFGDREVLTLRESPVETLIEQRREELSSRQIDPATVPPEEIQENVVQALAANGGDVDETVKFLEARRDVMQEAGMGQVLDVMIQQVRNAGDEELKETIQKNEEGEQRLQEDLERELEKELGFDLTPNQARQIRRARERIEKIRAGSAFSALQQRRVEKLEEELERKITLLKQAAERRGS